MTFAYDGSKYNGYQKQKHDKPRNHHHQHNSNVQSFYYQLTYIIEKANHLLYA